MKHSMLLLSGVAVLLVVLTSGCVAQTFFDETAFVENDYVKHYSIEVIKPPLSLDVTLKTDGKPVDLLVLDESNFKIYSDGFSSGIYKPFRTVGLNPAVIESTDSFELTKKGIYYVVVENGDYLKDGCNAGRGVRYQIEISGY